MQMHNMRQQDTYLQQQHPVQQQSNNQHNMPIHSSPVSQNMQQLQHNTAIGQMQHMPPSHIMPQDPIDVSMMHQRQQQHPGQHQHPEVLNRQVSQPMHPGRQQMQPLIMPHIEVGSSSLQHQITPPAVGVSPGPGK